MEALDKAVRVGEIALEHPVHCPIVEAELAQLLHPRDESRRIGGEHPVDERDPHRPGRDRAADAWLRPEVGSPRSAASTGASGQRNPASGTRASPTVAMVALRQSGPGVGSAVQFPLVGESADAEPVRDGWADHDRERRDDQAQDLGTHPPES